MRKLKIWNHDKTSFLDLNSNKYLVDEISGFGTGYKLIGEGTAIHDIEVEFENITLRINFGVNQNAYISYKEFMDLIVTNEKNKLILEYDYNGAQRFCDLYLQNAPKTQKTNYNIITENFIFKRITPWYELVEVNAPGTGSPYQLAINNTHFVPISLIFESTKQTGSITLILEKAGLEVGRIAVALKSGYNLRIDSETKEALFFNGNTTISAYDNINHTYNSFLEVPSGNYLLNESTGSNLKISYKKWVAD